MVKKKKAKRRSASKMFAADSKFIKASDIGGPVILTIDRIGEEKMSGDGKLKPVCHWDDDDFKPLVINKTNGRKMAELFGDDPDDWEDQEVELFLIDTQDREGNSCKGVRIRAPKKKNRRHDSTDDDFEETEVDEQEEDDV